MNSFVAFLGVLWSTWLTTESPSLLKKRQLFWIKSQNFQRFTYFYYEYFCGTKFRKIKSRCRLQTAEPFKLHKQSAIPLKIKHHIIKILMSSCQQVLAQVCNLKFFLYAWYPKFTALLDTRLPTMSGCLLVAPRLHLLHPSLSMCLSYLSVIWLSTIIRGKVTAKIIMDYDQ